MNRKEKKPRKKSEAALSENEELFAKWKEMERKGEKESSDAEIGMNNGRRAVWIVRLSSETKHERTHWNTVERDEQETAVEHKRWIMRRYRKWDCK